MFPEESLWCPVAETKLIFLNRALICACNVRLYKKVKTMAEKLVGMSR